MQINVKEARSKFSALLDLAAGGEEIILLRRGKEVARLTPPHDSGKRLPSLEELRSSIRIKGDPLSEAVIQSRQEERY